MTLVTLPNLYCQPSDVYGLLGEEGVQLRLDDRRLASGQTIRVVADAVAGATLLQTTALSSPLLAGTVLVMDGGGLESLAEVTLQAVAPVGSTSLATVALPAAIPAGASASDSGVTLAKGALLLKGCRIGTSEVKRWCCPRYDDDALAQCWSVNDWATTIAARWVSMRRGQGAPGSLQKEYERVREELKFVRAGVINLEDVGTRTSGWPFLSNVTLDLGYDHRRLRVQPYQSEQTPTQFAQQVDWNSVFWIEF